MPQRVTGKKRPGPLAALLRGHLAFLPSGERLGVLLPGDRRTAGKRCKAVLDLLRPAERALVELAPWFGTCLPECDRLLALGVPGVPPRTVRRRLAQCGNDEAALSGGDWGEVTWNGERADGTVREVRGRGYRHPDWAAAYRDAVLDLHRRRLAGVTVPVVIVADLDLALCLPLEDGPKPLDEKDVRLLEALGR